MSMNHQRQELTYGPSLGHSMIVPAWVEYVDIVNDGGRPLNVSAGDSPQICRTGARVSMHGRSLRITIDTDLNAQFPSTAMPRIAFLSADAARVTPPPPLNLATEKTERDEVVVNGAGARLVVYPSGTIGASVKNKSAGSAWVGSTAAQATAKIVEILGGESIEWEGPAFVFTDTGANQTLTFVFEQQRLPQ